LRHLSFGVSDIQLCWGPSDYREQKHDKHHDEHSCPNSVVHQHCPPYLLISDPLLT
jgi:hypothetical protein